MPLQDGLRAVLFLINKNVLACLPLYQSCWYVENLNFAYSFWLLGFRIYRIGAAD